jgi:hypothetical protein
MIDAIQFDGLISPVGDFQFGCLFDDSSILADDGEESAFSLCLTDDDRPRDDEASVQIHEANGARSWDTMPMRTEDEHYGDSAASIPLRQSLSGVQEYDAIQFQGGESPLHCDDGFFTPDISARDADDLFLDSCQVVGPAHTVNYNVLAAMEALAGSQGATIGGTAAALTGVADNCVQSFTNKSPSNHSATNSYMQLSSAGFLNIDSTLPQIIAAQQRTSDQTSVNTSLIQQQCMQLQQQASQICWNSNMYQESDQWNDVSLPLVHWIEMEKMRALQDHKTSVLRKLNVAYGIGKLLQSSKPAQESCSVENFIIRESSHPCNNMNINNTGWEVVGIRMIDPPVAVQLISTAGGNTSALSSLPASACNMNDACKNDNLMGRDVSAIIVKNDSTFPERQSDFESVEMQLCCALGELLHFLFSEERVQHEGLGQGTDVEDVDAKQAAKKQSIESFSQVSIISNHDADCSSPTELRSQHKFRPLVDYGYPPSISQVSQMCTKDYLSCNLFNNVSSVRLFEICYLVVMAFFVQITLLNHSKI